MNAVRSIAGIGIGLAVAISGVLLPSTAASAGGPLPPAPPAPPPPVILDTRAIAVLDWSVPSRFDASWAAWNSATGTYDKAFVTAANGWSVSLNGCASTSLYKIMKYSFTIQRVGGGYSWSGDSATCERTVTNLPAQGSYRASLTLHTHGVLDGVSRPTTTDVTIRDYLIVSIGDSLASGEGAPDQQGDYDVDVDWDGDISATVVDPVVWRDRRCHRSAQSGPAMAARRYEHDDPKTSVTFLSVACSGAKIQHLYDWLYDGIESGSTQLRSQIDVIADLVGSPSGRRIDSLLITAGANNLGFGKIIDACATKFYVGADDDECVISTGVEDKLATVPGQYDRLAAALHAKLPNVARTFINTYPANVFSGGGCGFINVRWIGIDPDEGAAIRTWGGKLNAEVRNAAARNHWTVVPDLTTAFAGHAYCPRVGSYFQSLEGSWQRQGNEDGTAHPNYNGHRVFGSLIRQALGVRP